MPPYRNLHRQSFPPAGVTTQCRPCPSESFQGRSRGFAARILASDRGMVVSSVWVGVSRPKDTPIFRDSRVEADLAWPPNPLLVNDFDGLGWVSLSPTGGQRGIRISMGVMAFGGPCQ